MSKLKLPLFYTLIFNGFYLLCCPFANGTYKKVDAPKLQEIQGQVQPIKINRSKLFDESLSRQLDELSLKKGESLKSDLSLESSTKDLYSAYQKLTKHLSLQKNNRYFTYLKDLRSCCEKSKIQTTHSWIEKEIDAHVFAHYTKKLKESFYGKKLYQTLTQPLFDQLPSDQMALRTINSYLKNILSIDLLQIYKNGWQYWVKMRLFGIFDAQKRALSYQVGQIQKTNRSLRVLRMGCPVISSFGKMKVDPLFKTYINLLEKNNQKHLYISLLNRQKKGWELKASELLNEEAKNHPSLTCIHLPMDGSFFNQLDQGQVFAKSFINHFEKCLLENQEGFLIPEHLKTQSFKEEIKTLFQTLLSTYFENKECLMQHERQNFIDLFYAHFAALMINAENYASVNWTCRHGIDRAMSALSIFQTFCEKKERGYEDTLYLSHWPSLVFYSRPPIVSRSVRAFSAHQKIRTAPTVSTSYFSDLHWSF